MPICMVCSYRRRGPRFDRVLRSVQPENIRTSGLTGPDVCFCFFLRWYLAKKVRKEQSIRHILITHQDTEWKTSRFRRCRKRCKGIRGSAVTLGSDHVQCVLQCTDNGGGMAYKSSSVFR